MTEGGNWYSISAEEGEEEEEDVPIRWELLLAANQLAIKLFHLNPKREPEKVLLRTKKLLEEIWRCSRELQLMKENGRVGEALGCPAPLEREGYRF